MSVFFNLRLLINKFGVIEVELSWEGCNRFDEFFVEEFVDLRLVKLYCDFMKIWFWLEIVKYCYVKFIILDIEGFFYF